MGDPRNGTQNGDNSYHCAFNFPAVIYTLGRERWDDLKKLYHVLSKDNQWKVRRTLSFSLHEVAAILGPELSKTELIPILNTYLHDANEVREGVMTNLPKFLATLDEADREGCLRILMDVQSEPNDWRIRELLASQIPDYVDLLKPLEIYDTLYPISLTLVQDQVGEVRQMASMNMASILNSIYSSEEMEIFEQIKEELDNLLLDGGHFRQRQSYIYLCEKVIELNESLFLEHFSQGLDTLSQDKVINVRISTSLSIQTVFQEYSDQTNPNRSRSVSIMSKSSISSTPSEEAVEIDPEKYK